MFDMHVVVADFLKEFPRKGDQFIMEVLIKTGYAGKTLNCLNRVPVSLHLLVMSDILMASGNKASKEILSCRLQGDAWSR